ncbi:MAG: Uncharacterized protein G01um101466_322 [Parcubacteria group bacterium Gr01-1014_66]|nr:MAG: Uncharacterized protein G01um101466_322 [Parcubacteria group bacterium Gr01-1014_66]
MHGAMNNHSIEKTTDGIRRRTKSGAVGDRSKSFIGSFAQESRISEEVGPKKETTVSGSMAGVQNSSSHRPFSWWRAQRHKASLGEKKNVPPPSLLARARDAEKNGQEISPLSRTDKKTAWLLRPRPQQNSDSLGVEISSSKKRGKERWWGIGFGFLCMGVILILVSTVFARVSVELTPRRDSFSFENERFVFEVDIAEVRSDLRRIPAEVLVFRADYKEEFSAGGRGNVKVPSSGRAMVYNRYSTVPQALVARTRFVTSEGIVFRSQKPLVIPAAKNENGKLVPQGLEVELIADGVGIQGNISGPVELRIPGFAGTPKYEGFYALAEHGFSGGVIGESAIVRQEDIKIAETEVTKKVFALLRERMGKSIPEGFESREGMRSIEIVSLSSPAVGKAAERFFTEADAEGKLFIFRKNDVITLLREGLWRDERAHVIPREETLTLSYQIDEIDFEKGKMSVRTSGELQMERKISSDAIRELIGGVHTNKIHSVLEGEEDIASFHIMVFPPWLIRVPENPRKLIIQGQDRVSQ